MANPPSISKDVVVNTEIPLPSLEYQQKLIDEIEESKKIVYETNKLIKLYTEKMKKIMEAMWSE